MRLKNLFFVFGIIFLFSFVSSAVSLSTPSFCCEKTKSGGICINAEQSMCDSRFQSAPTSCEQTSFCKLGTCYNSKEGICMENVPQKICMERNGSWSEKKAAELPQCQLGCCIIGDQASLVPFVRCKRLSSYYGVEMDYRKSVTSESDCILLANSQDMGACVTYTDLGINECKFTTRKDCGAKEGVIALNINRSSLNVDKEKKFYPGMLCSAEELSTECARQFKTGCYQGKVYWFDSCGNRENIYSSDKDLSWNRGRVTDPDKICSRNSGNDKNCGNCDYLLGSVCSKWDGTLGLGKPSFGEYFCKKTVCRDMNGKTRLNGESWCVYDLVPGEGIEKVGSRHFRQICLDGEVITDPCADFRNQICIHSGIQTSQGEFSTAACRVNRWQDCFQQTRKRDCENVNVRDCIWVDAVEGLDWNKPQQTTLQKPIAFQNPTSKSSFSNAMQGVGALNSAGQMFGSFTGGAITNVVGSGKGIWEIDYDLLNKVTKFNKTENEEGGLCVPLVPPGNRFWQGEGMCSLASAVCEVTIKRTERYSGAFAGLDAEKVYDYEIVNTDGVEVESECLAWENGKAPKGKKSYSLIPKRDWAVRVNSICTSMGDCGANYNINDVYTDEGYIWRYKNSSFSLLGRIKTGLQSKGTGYSVLNKDRLFIINNNLSLNKGNYVLIKISDSKYSLKRVEEIEVGDVIVASDGEEIKVEKIGEDREQLDFYKEDKSFTLKLWEKIAGKEIPKKVVSGGSSGEGLSLGEYGTGIKIFVEEK